MLEKEASVKEERAFSRYFWTYWIDNWDIFGKLGGLLAIVAIKEEVGDRWKQMGPSIGSSPSGFPGFSAFKPRSFNHA